MPIRSFVDTSILVYPAVSDEPAKQRIALDLLKQLFAITSGVLSIQVLQF